MDINNYFPLIALKSEELACVAPLLTISFGAVLSLLVGTHKTKGHGLAYMTSFIFLLSAIFQGSFSIFSQDITLIAGSLTFNPFTKTVGLMIMIFALIGIIVTYGQDFKEGLLAEIYSLILFSAAGMILMVSTSHLLFMFIALEIMSLAVYVMVGMRRSSRFSSEAAMKYFILGGLASAMLLYGSSLVFGSLGSFDLGTINSQIMQRSTAPLLYMVGVGLIIVAMLFKVGAFPFHGWLPDVYQGASTNVTGYMGASVKFTAFVALAKISQNLVFVDHVNNLKWAQHFLWFTAAASMIYGNFVAISQTELKRMLSFSTIAHSGYLLLGLFAMNASKESSQYLVLYLFFYALANLGAFSVISLFEEKNQKDLHLEQIAGIGFKHPVLSALFTVFLLSMAGIPLTSGFIGKYGLFSSAVSAGEVPLVVIAVLTSVVSVYYYLRVIVFMFMKEPTSSLAKYQKMQGPAFAAFLTALATLQFGLFPKTVVHFVKMIAK